MSSPGQRRLVRAYVDETGDRGTSVRSSRFFAMAGVVVAEEDDDAMRDAIGKCRSSFAVPVRKALHWHTHVKTFARRQFTTSQLATVPCTVNYVIFEKAALPATAGMLNDHVLFYNYAAGLMLERLLMTARDWPGGPRDLVARFGHVRSFDHSDTLRYFDDKRFHTPPWTPWHLLRGSAKFVGMDAYDGLQAADQYAGMLKAALCADELGGHEPYHLLAVRHQIRRVGGKAWGYGFKVMGRPGTMQKYPWWPKGGI